MSVTYEAVKEHMLRYHRTNAHMSRHNQRDPDHLAVVAMGAPAARFLFQLMRDYPFEACHFGYNIIPLLIDPPEHIVKKMNMEAISEVAPGSGFHGLNVRKMKEIYQEWGREIGAV
jgi:hypothetical protein